jgi:hypothetical protein
MIFTAYFDESGTHAGAELTTMAGFLGDARQWRKFEKRTGKLFKRFHVNVFHAIDVRRTDKDFAGWSVDRKIEFFDEFHHIINETLESGVAAFLRHENYRYYCGLNWPKKTRRDSKYAILFHTCLAQVFDTVEHIPLGHEPRLRVVLEDGHKNAGDVVRVYNWAKSRTTAAHALAGLTFDNKRTCLPLASADLFAYLAWGKEVGQKPIGIAKKRIKSEASYRGNMFGIMLTRDNLHDLHEQAIQSAADFKSS